jgi:hypothetical protein
VSKKRPRKLVSRRTLLKALREDEKRWRAEHASGMSGQAAEAIANDLLYWIGFVERMKVYR